jgi:hypothetical protein
MEIKLPKKPRVIHKEQQPDQRQFSVVPIRAITDRTLTGMELRVLMMFCSYTNRGGLTWVGLAKIGKHLNVSTVRAAFLTRSLITKGYIRVLYKGFAGERAQTRQIIYNATLSVEDIVSITGEPPPYIIAGDEKSFNNQQHKGETMAKRKLLTKNTVNDSALSNLKEKTIDDNKLIERINEEQVLQLQRTVGADILAHVISQCDANPTLEQVQSKLKELLA